MRVAERYRSQPPATLKCCRDVGIRGQSNELSSRLWICAQCSSVGKVHQRKYRKAGARAKVSSATDTSEASSSRAKDLVPVGNDAAAATVQSVTITPSKPVVAIGSTTQLKAIATFKRWFGQRRHGKLWLAVVGRAHHHGQCFRRASRGSPVDQRSSPAATREAKASVSASSAIGEVDWSGPIVITEGGTYSGNWQSTDAKTPAVTVSTTAPVVIENSHIRSAGNLIADHRRGQQSDRAQQSRCGRECGCKGPTERHLPRGHFAGAAGCRKQLH